MEPEELKSDGDCEMLWIQLDITGTSNLYVGAFYRPPDADDPEYIAQLDSSLARIPAGSHIWLGGDFNLAGVNWDTCSVSVSANKTVLCNQLINLANDRFLEQMVTEPTRITQTTENILDLFFTNNNSLVNSVEVIPGISDHEALYVESSLRPHKGQFQRRKVFIYKRANYADLRSGLRNLLGDITSSSVTTVDALWSTFKDRITLLMEKHIPRKTMKGQKTQKPWIDRKVRTAIRQQKKLYTKMKKGKNENTIKKYKCQKAAVQKLESQAYFEYINNLIEIEETEHDRPSKQKRFWNYIKSLRKDNTGISPLKHMGRLFNAPRDKADILNRQYMSVFTDEDQDDIPSLTGTPLPSMEEIVVTTEGIEKLLRNTNPRKASGPDSIPGRVLKECAEELAPILAIIFNTSLKQGLVPTDWRHANVTAIYKKGARHDPANYRPVSLTCLCCKLFEHVIVSNMIGHLDKHQVLHDCQHGQIKLEADQLQLQKDLDALAAWEQKWGYNGVPPTEVQCSERDEIKDLQKI